MSDGEVVARAKQSEAEPQMRSGSAGEGSPETGVSADRASRLGCTRTTEPTGSPPSVPVTLSADSSSGGQSREAAPPRSSTQVRDPARYQILGEHGRGGLGRVSRAHDQDLGRDIAIKELLSRGHVEEVRFAREALITARLEHPGIVPIYEAGRWPDGTPFYAMKLVSGRPLRALIAERKTVEERIGLLHHVIAVADAIAYAHRKHIIHRDLKPGNVIVGEFGETVVIDWGLAKDLSEPADELGGAGVLTLDDDLTSAGAVLGTPAYMAPEQARGERVDQRADVFAIGAMLWELCALQKVPPVDAALRHRILRRSGIDEDLIAIIDKAIDPDARGRYRAAGELAADLKAFKSGARIAARDYSLLALLAHWTRRHRTLALSGLAFMVLMVVAVIGLTVLYRSSRDNAVLANHNAATANERLVQSYEEQGRHALLNGDPGDASVYLAMAYEQGDRSPAVTFMLARALQPKLAERARLTATSGRMWSVVFSPDGQRIVTGDDRGARVWDAGSHRLLFTLPHDEFVAQALYVPDGTKLVTVGFDGYVKIWDAGTGKRIHALADVRDGRTSVAYLVGAVSPDGSIVAALEQKGTLAHLWDVATGAPLATISIPGSGRPAMAFSQDGRWLAVAGGEAAHVFDTRSWQRTLTLAATGVRALSFDPTGPRLVTGTARGDAEIWAIPAGTRILELRGGDEPIKKVVYSANGELVLAATGEGVTRVWQARTGQLQARFRDLQGPILAAELDAASKLVVAAGAEGQVVISDVETGMPLWMFKGSNATAIDAHFDPSAHRVAVAFQDGSARVWDLSSPQRPWTSEVVHRDCGTDVTLDGDRRYLAVSCAEHGARVWDTASDRLLAELPGVKGAGPTINWPLPAVSADGARAAIARETTVSIYALPGGQLVGEVHHAAPVTSVAFASSGHTLISGSADGMLLVAPEGQERISFAAQHGAVDAVRALPDGRVIAAYERDRLRVYDVARKAVLAELALSARVRAIRVSPDQDRMITIGQTTRPSAPVLWDLGRYRMIAQLDGHKGQLFSAQFVRNGQEILTGGSDRILRLWDGVTGDLRKAFPAASSFLMDAALSPDGSLIISAGGDGMLEVWDITSGMKLWRLRAHGSMISGVHFEGRDLVTRGFTGEVSRWSLPVLAPTSEVASLIGCLARDGAASGGRGDPDHCGPADGRASRHSDVVSGGAR